MESAIRARLESLADPGYRDFQCRLLPTVEPAAVLGVRMPDLRRLARALSREEAAAFLAALPHPTYDENNLHGLLICRLRDYDETVAALNRFLPCVDNWATCDLMRPAAFRRRPAPLLPQIQEWLRSGQCYTVRFALGVLLSEYLDEGFQPVQLDWAAAACCGEYYVNMMVAWYVATALAKQYEAALPLLAENRLPEWVHNRTIQKAVESRRISAERKAYLRTLRRRDGNLCNSGHPVVE